MIGYYNQIQFYSFTDGDRCIHIIYREPTGGGSRQYKYTHITPENFSEITVG